MKVYRVETREEDGESGGVQEPVKPALPEELPGQRTRKRWNLQR